MIFDILTIIGVTGVFILFVIFLIRIFVEMISDMIQQKAWGFVILFIFGMFALVGFIGKTIELAIQ